MAEESTTINYNEAPSSLSEQFFVEDLRNRKLILDTIIGEDTFRLIGYYILKINAEDKDIPPEKRKPIKLYIACDGGVVIDGLNLINIMRASQTPIHTIIVGQAYSMAFYIGACGDKRYAFPLSTFLIHDGSFDGSGSQRKLKDYMDFSQRIEDKLKDIVIEKTNITLEEFEGKDRTEWYMCAEEAKEKGIIDYIVGEDCLLEEVI